MKQETGGQEGRRRRRECVWIFLFACLSMYNQSPRLGNLLLFPFSPLIVSICLFLSFHLILIPGGPFRCFASTFASCQPLLFVVCVSFLGIASWSPVASGLSSSHRRSHFSHSCFPAVGPSDWLTISSAFHSLPVNLYISAQVFGFPATGHSSHLSGTRAWLPVRLGLGICTA
ncbi:uncharacterized protein BO97DRAFT_213705 [Aspergillus homomorphus CBS 101889]|uniref:Uncharacterized protein n=1 Tax=Aspergillus homomorphus (strain CBS 101889) TaxID=1450537 RepID=A0A395I6M6_ASPHC|nr:hypothetical protein BO97DRAFT_213705 [Aspergillus homomorphus CBS 101889]RAL15496.1 hypothetical protein BO97DRAFT_213705 [Aspergillus homomorphus CBS 101889]